MFTFCWFFFHFRLLPFSLFFVFGLIQLGHEKYNWYSTRQFIFIGFTFQCKYNNSFWRRAHWEWVDNWIANYRFYHIFLYVFVTHLDAWWSTSRHDWAFFRQKWSIFSTKIKHFLKKVIFIRNEAFSSEMANDAKNNSIRLN